MSRSRQSPATAPRLGRAAAALAGTAAGLVRPRRPTPAELAAVSVAGPPRARRTVRLRALPQRRRAVPALVAEGCRGPRLGIGLTSYVLDHPGARVLVEPAVATDVGPRVVDAGPRLLRPATYPPADTLSTIEGLARAGIDPASIDFALATHLHWDHVSGLLDLPGLALVVHGEERAWAEAEPPLGAAAALAGREVRPVALDGAPVLTLPRSHDLFGDGSVVLVDLAGHTPGSVGLLLATAAGPLLLAGDAAWHGAQVDAAAQKADYPGRFVDVDREATYRTLVRLHVARDLVRVLPTHDHDRASAWCA